MCTQGDPINMADSDCNRSIVSDDEGNLVLGYSSTEGHYHSSSTSVYRNGSSSTKKTTKKTAKKKTTKATSFTNKDSYSNGLGDGARLQNIAKTAISTIGSLADAGRSVGILCGIFANLVTIPLTCLDPNMNNWQKAAVIGIGLVFTIASIAVTAPALSIGLGICGYLASNGLANYFDYDTEKKEGEDVKFNFCGALLWH